MFELRSDEKKFPIQVESFEKACAIIQASKLIFGCDLFLTGEIPNEFDISTYELYLTNIVKTDLPDIIILGKDLANLQQKEDYSVLLQPIIDANEKLVQQYKDGNDKALNSLMGKFLKENKGYDPKEIKEELIKLL